MCVLCLCLDWVGSECERSVRVGRHEIYKFIPCQVHIYNKMYNASKFSMFYDEIQYICLFFFRCSCLACVVALFLFGAIIVIITFGIVDYLNCSCCIFFFVCCPPSIFANVFSTFLLGSFLEITNKIYTLILVYHFSGQTAMKRNARRTTIKQIMAFSSLCSYICIFGRVQFRFYHICNI